jgi:hypothetical protein
MLDPFRNVANQHLFMPRLIACTEDDDPLCHSLQTVSVIFRRNLTMAFDGSRLMASVRLRENRCVMRLRENRCVMRLRENRCSHNASVLYVFE